MIESHLIRATHTRMVAVTPLLCFTGVDSSRAAVGQTTLYTTNSSPLCLSCFIATIVSPAYHALQRNIFYPIHVDMRLFVDTMPPPRPIHARPCCTHTHSLSLLPPEIVTNTRDRQPPHLYIACISIIHIVSLLIHCTKIMLSYPDLSHAWTRRGPTTLPVMIHKSDSYLDYKWATSFGT
jgi:hypothetical protein